MIRLVEDTKTFPLAGGILDQCDSFMEAYRFYTQQRDHWLNSK